MLCCAVTCHRSPCMPLAQQQRLFIMLLVPTCHAQGACPSTTRHTQHARWARSHTPSSQVPTHLGRDFVERWTRLGDDTLRGERGARVFLLRRLATENGRYFGYGAWDRWVRMSWVWGVVWAWRAGLSIRAEGLGIGMPATVRMGGRDHQGGAPPGGSLRYADPCKALFAARCAKM